MNMNSKEIYLDNAATTKPSPQVIEAVNQAMNETWGNPSSVHAAGIAASKVREQARSRLLSALGVRFGVAEQLIFTASGTEADNLAVLGVANAKHYGSSPCLITTDSEHPAISQPALYLERHGWQVVRLSTKGGVIDPNSLMNALNERVVLVSIMAANNETGAIYDLKTLFSLVHRHVPKALTHTDAVQAFGKIPFHPEKLGADMVSISAHKIHGLKGAGALYISRDVIKRRCLSPLIHGGGQEGGMRSGTESVPCLAAFGQAALPITSALLSSEMERTKELRAMLVSGLDPRVTVNQPTGDYLSGILSITLPGIRSEIMLRYLSERGIYVSAGSACSSGHGTESPVLLAFGLTPAQADCTIRVSFSPELTEEDACVFTSVLREGLDSLAKIR